MKTCTRCNGKGHRIVKQQIAPGFVQQFQEHCHTCDGKGQIITSTCHVCHGAKLTDSIDSLIAYVEKGSPDGHVIEFKDAADEFLNVRSGIVKVKVEELPHHKFKRVGDDLKVKVNISLRDAMLGFGKELIHLDGHEVEIDRLNKVTKPGFVERIQGEGMPKADFSGDHGDLIITY